MSRELTGINLNTEILYHRHRLSRSQIDDLPGDFAEAVLTSGHPGNDWKGSGLGEGDISEKVNQLNRIAEFILITNELRGEGIWFIPFKGPLLSYRIYGDATYRRFNDFDILVNPGDARRTIEIFRNIGYRTVSLSLPGPGRRERRILKYTNQKSLIRPGDDTLVEVHWRLLKYPVIKEGKMREIMEQNTGEITFAGQKFNHFTTEFELLHLAVHGGLHAWARLKWLVDIHEIVIRFEIDKDKFTDLVKAFRAKRMAGLCNAMLRHFFPDSPLLPVDYKIPDWFLKYALHRTARETTLPIYLPEDYFKYARYSLYVFPGMRYKLRRLFPLIMFMLKTYVNKWLLH
jgi:hypothetical protein